MTDNVDYANIRLTGYAVITGGYNSKRYNGSGGIIFDAAHGEFIDHSGKNFIAGGEDPSKLSDGIKLDTSFQASYKSNERESRPKTKFFSLLIYAGYPMQ